MFVHRELPFFNPNATTTNLTVNLRVGFEVAADDGCHDVLCQLDDLLLTTCNQSTTSMHTNHTTHTPDN